MGNGRLLKVEESPDLASSTILIDGSELREDVQVLSIQVQRELNRIPYAKLVLLDGSPADADFPLSNRPDLLPGKPVEIALGYHSSDEEVFTGVVISQRLKVRDGVTQLIIECRDKATKMTLARKSGYYYDSKDSEVIETLISRNGLEAEVADANYTHPELVQYGVTDWDFMVTRAQANGMACLVNAGRISVFRPDLEQESLGSVVFGSTILELDAEMDGRNQYEQVNAFGWDSADQEVLKIEGNDPRVGLNGNVSPADLVESFGSGVLELRHGGRLSDVQLQDWADAKWLFQQLAKTRGRVKCQGISTVLPGKIITLEGVGDRFNGNVFVSGVFHQYAEGNWTTDVQFGLDPAWFVEMHHIQTPAASGLFGAIKGLQIGKVTQLEGDPDGEDRILVRIPIINDQEQGVWCRLSNLDAGADRGAFFRPEIGDEIVVGFINEDPNQGVVLGMLHSSSNPSPRPAADDNHEKGFISRSGIELVFDDDKKSFLLRTPNGKKLHISEDEDAIILEDDHGNSITLDSEGIALQSSGDLVLKSTGDITLDGTNVNVKAQSQFKAEGSAGAEVSTSGTAVLKGSLVQIN